MWLKVALLSVATCAFALTVLSGAVQAIVVTVSVLTGLLCVARGWTATTSGA